MNWRAIGCGTLAVVAFVAVGLWGMSKAFEGPEGCPSQLQWGDRVYLSSGSPRPEPSFAEGAAVELGSTFIGLTTRQAWGPPGSAPSTSAANRPSRIYLDCGDGSVLLYAVESPAP